MLPAGAALTRAHAPVPAGGDDGDGLGVEAASVGAGMTPGIADGVIPDPGSVGRAVGEETSPIGMSAAGQDASEGNGWLGVRLSPGLDADGCGPPEVRCGTADGVEPGFGAWAVEAAVGAEDGGWPVSTCHGVKVSTVTVEAVTVAPTRAPAIRPR